MAARTVNNIMEAFTVMTGTTMGAQEMIAPGTFAYYQDPANAAALIANANAKLAAEYEAQQAVDPVVQDPVVQQPVDPVVQDPVVQQPVDPVVQDPVVQDPVLDTIPDVVSNTNEDTTMSNLPENLQRMQEVQDAFFAVTGRKMSPDEYALYVNNPTEQDTIIRRAAELNTPVIEDSVVDDTPIVEDSVDTSVDPVLDTVPEVDTTSVGNQTVQNVRPVEGGFVVTRNVQDPNSVFSNAVEFFVPSSDVISTEDTYRNAGPQIDIVLPSNYSFDTKYTPTEVGGTQTGGTKDSGQDEDSSVISTDDPGDGDKSDIGSGDSDTSIISTDGSGDDGSAVVTSPSTIPDGFTEEEYTEFTDEFVPLFRSRFNREPNANDIDYHLKYFYGDKTFDDNEKAELGRAADVERTRNLSFSREVTDFFLRTLGRPPSSQELDAYTATYYRPEQNDFSLSQRDIEQELSPQGTLFEERKKKYGLDDYTQGDYTSPGQITRLLTATTGKSPTADERSEAYKFFEDIGQYGTNPRQITARDAQAYKEQVVTPRQLATIPINVTKPPATSTNLSPNLPTLPSTPAPGTTATILDDAVTGGIATLPTGSATTPPTPVSITPDTDVYSEQYFKDKFLPKEEPVIDKPVGLARGGNPLVEGIRSRNMQRMTRARDDLKRIMAQGS